MLFTSYSETLGGIPIRLEKVPLSQRKSLGFSFYSGSGMIPGGKEEDKARQAVLLTPLNPFGKDPEEEKPKSDYTVPQEAPYETNWNRNQDAV